MRCARVAVVGQQRATTRRGHDLVAVEGHDGAVAHAIPPVARRAVAPRDSAASTTSGIPCVGGERAEGRVVGHLAEEVHRHDRTDVGALGQLVLHRLLASSGSMLPLASESTKTGVAPQ